METTSSRKRLCEISISSHSNEDPEVLVKRSRATHVSFSLQIEEICGPEDPCLSIEECLALRKELWYQRSDFATFNRERVATLKAYKSLGAQRSLLEENHSIRGLEIYESTSLNAEMRSHRYMHHQTVFKEQARQKRAGIKYDPVRIYRQVSHLSDWALKRAQNMAKKDEMDTLSLKTSSNVRLTPMMTPPSQAAWKLSLQQLEQQVALLKQKQLQNVQQQQWVLCSPSRFPSTALPVTPSLHQLLGARKLTSVLSPLVSPPPTDPNIRRVSY